MSTLVNAYVAGSWIGRVGLALAVIASTSIALIAGFIRNKSNENHVRTSQNFYQKRCWALARRHRLNLRDVRWLQSLVHETTKIF